MIRTLVATEAKQHLRDPLTLVLMVGMPVLLYPLLGAAGVRLSARQEEAADARQLTVGVEGAFELPAGLTAVPLAAGEGGEIAVREGRVQAAVRVGEPTDVWFDSREPASRDARDKVVEAVRAAAHQRAALRVTEVDAVSPAQRYREAAARAAPGILVFTMLLGGVYTALDLVTGERERGTLETLLVTSVDRRKVLFAKFLLVLGLTWTTAALSLVSGWAGAWLLTPIDIPFGMVALALALFVPLAVVLAAILLLVAAWVPDFKTGQVATMPLLAFPALAAGAAMAPSVAFTPFIAALPITNLSVALREVLIGHVDPLPLAVCAITSTVYAGAALWAATLMLGREDVVLGARGPAQRRLRNDYRIDAAVLYLIGVGLLWFIGQAAQTWDAFWGMAITQLGLFVPLALAAPSYFGLPVRETLGLRAFSLRDLALAVAIGLCAPGIGLTAQWLQGFVLTTPTGLFDTMIDLKQPLWQILVMYAILPGLCEELLFRGAFFGLLRKNTGAVGTVVVAAIAFGLFHLSLFRIVPTATLGILLGTLAWRGRSTGVSMVAHALNNAVALCLGVLWPTLEFGWWAPALGGVAIGLVVGVGHK